MAISAVLTGSTYANPFSDVPAGHWAYGAVNSVVNSGMMKGYPKGMFKGKETVNRYQMATIISRLLKRAGGSNDADVRRTLDRLGEEFMDELDLIGARLLLLKVLLMSMLMKVETPMALTFLVKLVFAGKTVLKINCCCMLKMMIHVFRSYTLLEC